MSVAFPAFWAQFWGDLRFDSVEFRLGENLLTAQTGGGEILTARRGQRLWSGVATISANTHDQQDQIRARLNLMQRPGSSFILYDPWRKYPQSDPTGSAINAHGSTVQVSSVASDRREITIKHLPNGYVLTRGDHVSIAYGSSPTRYYLGQVVTGATTQAGSPTTCTVELAPDIPATVTENDVVSVDFPHLKAVYVPNSFSGGERNRVGANSFSFEWRQTLR